MLGHDDCDSEVVDEAGDRGQHVLSAGRVQGRRGLVEDDDLGVGGEHRADGDALLLAAGELAQCRPTQVGDAEDVEGLLDPLAHRRGGEAQLLHAVGELLLDGVRDEPGEGILADDTDEVGEVARAVLTRVAPVDADVSGEGAPGEVWDVPGHRAEEGGLARSGAADDEDELALVDGQADVTQHRLAGTVEGHRDPVELDHDATPLFD